jgi:hypothetical protein
MGGYSVNRLLMDCGTTPHFQKTEASTKHEELTMPTHFSHKVGSVGDTILVIKLNSPRPPFS